MRIRDFIRAERGGVSIVTALSSVALLGFTGLATDVGAVFLESRRLQGAADLAAITAAQNMPRARALASATIGDNGWRNPRVRTRTGSYAPDRSIPPARRFRPNAAAPNAVHVEVTTEAPLFFARLFVPNGAMTIRREATAAQMRAAAFQIGSRLLSLRGGAANDVLSALTGSEVDLSVMDYNALLSADVELFQYVEALRTRLDIEAASYDATLSHDAEAGEALEAMADVLAGADTRAERAMRAMAQAASRSGRDLELGDVIDLGPHGAQDHVQPGGGSEIHVSAMDLASAILQVAGGERQVRLELDAAAPGLADTNIWLAIGERPNQSAWVTLTDSDEVVVRTAQVRLYIETNVNAAGVGAVRVPVLLELASAQARLEDVRCSSDVARRSVSLDVAPAIGALTLGEVDTRRLDDFHAELRPDPAQLVRTPIVRIDGEARIEVGGAHWQRVNFSGDDIRRGTVKSVSTRDAARATISSLLAQTELTVRAGGLSVGTGVLTAAVRNALGQAGAPLDGLLNGVSDLLGVRLGEADVRVNGVRCAAGLVA